MTDLRISKPRTGVQIWLNRVDLLSFMLDETVMKDVLEVATEEELVRLSKWIDLELNSRENNQGEK